MKKLLFAIALSTLAVACGGSDFVGSGAQQEDAGLDVEKEASTEAGEPDARTDSAGDVGQVDAAVEAGGDAIVSESSVEASSEASIEAGQDVQPDVCVPGTCQSLGRNCGPTPDGCGGTISSCGACPSNQSCGGGGTPNVCGGCVPDTCAAHGWNCGKIEDGCGNTVACGPAYHKNDVSGMLCGYNGLPPHEWICGTSQNSNGPKPFADCVLYPGTPGMYCCPEEQ